MGLRYTMASMSSKKIRLDELVAQHQTISVELAKKLILAGKVRVKDQPVDKCGQLVSRDSSLQVLSDSRRFVSRSGEKLDGVLTQQNIDVSGLTALDVGISTGGFTDCLLNRGASHVVGIDVSYGLTDLKIRDDARVTLLERTNARKLTLDSFQKAISKRGLVKTRSDFKLVVMDVSFISVQKVISRDSITGGPGGVIYCFN